MKTADRKYQAMGKVLIQAKASINLGTTNLQMEKNQLFLIQYPQKKDSTKSMWGNMRERR